jgi:hypothetical protein
VRAPTTSSGACSSGGRGWEALGDRVAAKDDRERREREREDDWERSRSRSRRRKRKCSIREPKVNRIRGGLCRVRRHKGT